MPAILYVCEPVFNKTSYHWKTPAPAQTLPAPEVEAPPEGGAKPLPIPEAERTEGPSPEREGVGEPVKKKKIRRGKKEKTPAGVK